MDMFSKCNIPLQVNACIILRSSLVVLAKRNTNVDQSPTNTMSTGETKSFPCEPNAKGQELTIRIPGEMRILTLCEVYAYGTGTVELNISTSSST